MLTRQDFEKIIGYGIYAPSGDNSQPWRFEAHESTGEIHLYNIPGKDNPVLNVGQRGSYIAHGALIENMLIAASHLGFKADLQIFPKGLADLTAIIKFSEAEPKNDQLFPYIQERTTNRRPYKNIPLTEAEKEVLTAACLSFSDCELKLIEGQENLKMTSKAMSVAEKVFLETKELHKLLFHSVFFDPERNKKGESGLYIKTLELPLPAQLIFKIINQWPIMKFFNLFGFSRLISKINASIYAASASHGAIIAEDRDENFINAGRAFQRVWLEASRLGLALQPVTGVIFLAQRLEKMPDSLLSEENTELVRQAAQKIAFIFGLRGNQVAAMTFRIGRADSPSARSKRQAPKIDFK